MCLCDCMERHTCNIDVTKDGKFSYKIKSMLLVQMTVKFLIFDSAYKLLNDIGV